MLCLQCHTGFHAQAAVPHSRLGFQTSGECTRCHVAIHGSELDVELLAVKGDLMRLRETHCLSPWQCSLLCGGVIAGAGQRGNSPHNLGGFNTQGSVTVGYRFDDVKGYVPMFQELSGLEKGFRLMDFNMFGEAAKGANPFADSYSLSVTGLGGEPFETGQLSVSKNRLYDFRANWRQSYFYSNPNDNVILPIAAVGCGAFHGSHR